MKRFNTQWLVLAGIFLFSGFVKGQQLTISPSDTFAFTTALTTDTALEVKATGGVTNNTADSVTVWWKPVSETFPDSNWQMAFCDPNSCYFFQLQNEGLGTTYSFILPPGAHRAVYFEAAPSCGAGNGIVNVLMWLPTDSAGTVQKLIFNANFTGSCLASAINNVGTTNIKIYPSPVVSQLNISGLYGFRNVTVSVYDVIGNRVLQTNCNDGEASTSLNMGNVYPGIYFVVVESEGVKLLTKRIEKR